MHPCLKLYRYTGMPPKQSDFGYGGSGRPRGEPSPSLASEHATSQSPALVSKVEDFQDLGILLCTSICVYPFTAIVYKACKCIICLYYIYIYMCVCLCVLQLNIRPIKCSFGANHPLEIQQFVIFKSSIIKRVMFIHSTEMIPQNFYRHDSPYQPSFQ